MTNTITISKQEYSQMKEEIEFLRKTSLYKRLLQFEENIESGKIFTRKDLGF
ncbi:hypothetical protein HYU50_00565 [Candidatus Woesearchaeota archaeon]|nr:hypothetical protein [Candidatus Woesearchaeota archaeon]